MAMLLYIYNTYQIILRLIYIYFVYICNEGFVETMFLALRSKNYSFIVTRIGTKWPKWHVVASVVIFLI